jgi:cardiolipin synthase A/B
VKCLMQPDEGAAPIVKAIDGAKKSVEVVIFRCNRRDIEKALADAVTRGVRVHALIAHTNHGGEKSLRALELRLLAGGITVARTGDDLLRYHSKLMIVDRRVLHLLAFNFTWLDIARSRSFGIVTTNQKHVQEAVKLFEADVKREPYTPGSATFLVSPLNARKQLATFLKGARRELLIYDPQISDSAMIRLLEARAKAGVSVQIIGKLTGGSSLPQARKMQRMRLHARCIIRDGVWAFLGSQSLRGLELDARREAGLIFRDAKVVRRLVQTFHKDWEVEEQSSEPEREGEEPELASAAKVAKKVGKAVANDIHPITPLVEKTIRELAGEDSEVDVELNQRQIEGTVKDAVRDAVRDVVRDFVEAAGGAKA